MDFAVTWKPLFPHRSKPSVRLHKLLPVGGLYLSCAIPLSLGMVRCLLSLNGLPAHLGQHLSPGSPNSPREQPLVLWMTMAAFTQLHQPMKKNFTSEVPLSQGKSVLLLMTTVGLVWAYRNFLTKKKVVKQSMLNIWRKLSDPSEMGVPKPCTVKQSELVPKTSVLEEVICTGACLWQCKVDGFCDWPLDWRWRKFQKRSKIIQFSSAEKED